MQSTPGPTDTPVVTEEEQWELANVVVSTLERVSPDSAERLRNPYDCGEPESVWFDGLPDLLEHNVQLDAHTLDLLEAASRQDPMFASALNQVEQLRQVAVTAAAAALRTR